MVSPCDICNTTAELPFVAAVPRPSDPTEIVVVMAACEICGPASGFVRGADLYDAFFAYHDNGDTAPAEALGVKEMVTSALFLSL